MRDGHVHARAHARACMRALEQQYDVSDTRVHPLLRTCEVNEHPHTCAQE